MEVNLFQFYLDLILCLVLGAGFVVLKFRNFMLCWFSVKRSGGSKLLVEVENPIQDYFAPGTFDNGYLRYRARRRADNPSPNRMISVEDINAVVYSKFGVKCIRVDDAKNVVRPRRSGQDSSIPGYNAEKMDEAVQTALLKPNPYSKGLFDTRTWQMIVLIAFVLLLGMAFLILRNVGVVDGHLQVVYTLVQNVSSTVSHPAPVVQSITGIA